MVDAIDGIKDQNSISAVGGADDLLNKSNSNKNLSQILLKESTNYLNDSQAKAEQAREYMDASKKLESMASAVRKKANWLRQGTTSEGEKAKSVDEVIKSLPDDLKEKMKMLVPSDAPAELLDQIADALEKRAKDLRTKADDLLKDSEQSGKVSKQLIEQANLVNKRDLRISDLHLKSGAAHNQGLLLVLKKLGIAKLDSEFKEQVAYSQSKAQ